MISQENPSRISLIRLLIGAILLQQIESDAGDDHGHMVLFDTEFGPNRARQDSTGTYNYGPDRGVAAPHRGQALFSLCDGSVRGISETIDLDLYRSLSSRSGNEVIGEF